MTDINIGMPPGKIYSGMAEVRDHLAEKGLGKNQTNTHQNFKFRGVDDLYGVLQPALKHGKVIMVPCAKSIERKEAVTSKGTVQYFTIVRVEYRFISEEDGSYLSVEYFGEAADSGDKSVSKALTMSLKYMAFHTFQIPLNGNEDADKDVAQETAAPTLDDETKAALEEAADKGVAAFRDYWKTLDKEQRKLAQNDKKWFDGLRAKAEA